MLNGFFNSFVTQSDPYIHSQRQYNIHTRHCMAVRLLLHQIRLYANWLAVVHMARIDTYISAYVMSANANATAQDITVRV